MPAKAVAARHGANAVMHHGDIVPIGEMRPDRIAGHRVVLLHPAQRVIRQNDAPAEGVIGAVAFQNGDLMRRIAQLHRDGEVKARRTAAKAQNLHSR
jgi:hypothetical protein